jgi:uncharacterized protein
MTRPLPHPTPVTEPFWDACRRHELVAQRCARCAAVQFYPRTSCTACGGTDLAWTVLSGRGTVYTRTIARRPTHRKLAERVPYVIAVVELAEGPRMTCTVVGAEPDEVVIGTPVLVDFEDHDDVSVPVFRVAG